ncbi:hypothetical protein A2U01_0100629 [Trifolium medium]|uniref:Uncharacterized protein n=1 Tax=Trifolium medium TaxID=97028 RepID=A0A392UTK1_9FABA|nr:hypothetical protein [Trifolium medium]
MARVDRTSIERVMVILVGCMFWAALLPYECSLDELGEHVFALFICSHAALLCAASRSTVHRVDFC